MDKYTPDVRLGILIHENYFEGGVVVALFVNCQKQGGREND